LIDKVERAANAGPKDLRAKIGILYVEPAPVDRFGHAPAGSSGW